MSRRACRFRSFVILSGLGLVLASAGMTWAQVDCGNANAVRRFGNPTTRFSTPVETRQALVQMFNDSRIDIELLLREAGWPGDPQDLFDAVSSGSVTRQSFAPGQRFGWMFFRENGQPTLKNDTCWAGGESFEGWEVQFTSRGQWFSMVVPTPCGNLSFLAQQAEPVCRVTVRDAAGRACSDTRFTVDASGSTGDVSVEVTTPSGRRQTLTSRDATSPLRWTFDSDEPQGTFRFVVRGEEQTPRGTTLQCRAETTVERNCCQPGPPTIALTASSTEVEPFEETTVTADPRVDDCAGIDRVTIDGEVVAAPYSRVLSWEVPGSYTVTGTVRDDFGGTGEGSVQITVTECRTKECKRRMRELRRGEGGSLGWTLRPYVGQLSISTDRILRDFGGSELLRHGYRLDNGTGFGLGAEYRFRERLGLGLGVVAAEPKFEFELDTAQLWGIEKENLSLLTFYAGPLFHLTPRSRVDLFAGPLVAYTDVDDVELVAFGIPFNRDFDNQFGLGAQLGLDIPFRVDGRWGLHLGTTWFDLSAETDPADFELAIDPFMFNLGLSYRFDLP